MVKSISEKPMTKTPVIRFSSSNSRRNFPIAISRKRTELLFLHAFQRAYINQRLGWGGIEFPLSGYGVADFVWIGWRLNLSSEDATALALEKIKNRISERLFSAFELKINDWRKGLQQAYRYSYFADRAIVVMPLDKIKSARQNLGNFKELKIGLWGFNRSTGKIYQFYTPTKGKAKNPTARKKAIALLLKKINLCKFSK